MENLMQKLLLTFFGKCGIWHELPLPNEIYDYDKYLTPDYILKKEDDNEEEVKDDSSKNDFKLII